MTVENGQHFAVGLPGFGFIGRSGTLKVATGEAPWYLDITDQVAQFIQEAGVLMGMAVVFSKHTTAAIMVNEKESLLLQDVTRLMERVAPRDGQYFHDDFEMRTENMTDEETPNAHAHLKHWLLGSSEAIPVIAGRLALGQWQRIFLVELDKPREREVVFQVMGFSGLKLEVEKGAVT